MTLALTAPAQAAVRAHGLRRLKRVRTASILGILLLWEIVGLLSPPIFLSPFHATVLAMVRLIGDGTLVTATLDSLSVLLVGLAASILLGIPIGLAMGRYRRVRWALEPFVNGLYATPTIAFLPVMTLWLGLHFTPKVTIVVLTAIFPILKNTYTGVGTVPQEFIEPAASMRASDMQMFRKVIMPAAFPYVVAGVRLSVGRAVVGVVVAEFFTAQTGLGGMLVRYSSSFQTAEMFVPIIVLVAIGMGLTEVVTHLQRRLAPWKDTERDQGV